jgi:hypothetical protein
MHTHLLMACASSMAKSASLPAVYSCARVTDLNLHPEQEQRTLIAGMEYWPCGNADTSPAASLLKPKQEKTTPKDMNRMLSCALLQN